MESNGRRKFISNSFTATAAVALGAPLLFNTNESAAGDNSLFNPAEPFKFTQVPLPFQYADLEPSIDALTNEIHYTKYHTAYIKNINDAIVAERISYTSENEFFANAAKLSPKVRNNAGGAWNHNFFWESLKPPGATSLEGKLKDALTSSFGSVDTFKQEFSRVALGRFGSGWAWLVNDGGKLKIGSTANQDNPLFDNSELKGIPLLGLDVWEHAYYLKFQNRRADYIIGFWNIINWNKVTERLA